MWRDGIKRAVPEPVKELLRSAVVHSVASLSCASHQARASLAISRNVIGAHRRVSGSFFSCRASFLRFGEEFVCVSPGAHLLAAIPPLSVHIANPPNARTRHLSRISPVGLPRPATPRTGRRLHCFVGERISTIVCTPKLKCRLSTSCQTGGYLHCGCGLFGGGWAGFS